VKRRGAERELALERTVAAFVNSQLAGDPGRAFDNQRSCENRRRDASATRSHMHRFAGEVRSSRSAKRLSINFSAALFRRITHVVQPAAPNARDPLEHDHRSVVKLRCKTSRSQAG